MKTVKFDKNRHKVQPWMTSGILVSIKHRDKLHTKITKAKTQKAKIKLEKRSMLHKLIKKK